AADSLMLPVRARSFVSAQFAPEPSLRSDSRLNYGPMSGSYSSRSIFCEAAFVRALCEGGAQPTK
ncbi:MAG: hypothetical protein ACLQVJ_05255, partial [Syntrophobacteraceae bacterium]